MQFVYVLAIALLATPAFGQIGTGQGKIEVDTRTVDITYFPTSCEWMRADDHPICCEKILPDGERTYACFNEELYYALVRLWQSGHPQDPGQEPPVPDAFGEEGAGEKTLGK